MVADSVHDLLQKSLNTTFYMRYRYSLSVGNLPEVQLVADITTRPLPDARMKGRLSLWSIFEYRLKWRYPASNDLCGRALNSVDN